MDTARARIQELRTALLDWHKQLLESEQHDYERSIEKVTSAGKWLDLVIHDPRFAWLRELSAFIVRIDEQLAAEEGVTQSDARRFLDEAKTLLTPSETGQGFARAYWDAMQRDPGVILAHAAMTKIHGRLAARTTDRLSPS